MARLYTVTFTCEAETMLLLFNLIGRVLYGPNFEDLRGEHPKGDSLDDGVSKNRPVVQWSEPPAHNREGAGSVGEAYQPVSSGGRYRCQSVQKAKPHWIFVAYQTGELNKVEARDALQMHPLSAALLMFF